MSTRQPSFLSAALVLAATLIMVPAAAADTWYVDDDNCPGPGNGSACNPFCRLRDAVNAAASGDVILIHDGVYRKAGINLGSKELRIQSLNGPDHVLLNGADGGSPVMIITGGQTTNTMILGLTFASAVANSGVRMLNIAGASPTIENCIFENNHATGYYDRGAVASIIRSSAVFNDCIFRNNSTSSPVSHAGAIWIADMDGVTPTRPEFNCCTFENNRTGRNGGAVYIDNAGATDVTFDGCLFRSNGHGIYAGNGLSVSVNNGGSAFVDCTFKDHSTGWLTSGAAAVVSGTDTTTFDRCVFENNHGSNGKANSLQVTRPAGYGGTTGSAPDVEVRECRFENNTGTHALEVSGTETKITIIDSQFINNTSEIDAAALWLRPSGHVYHGSSVWNCLFQGNTSAYNGGAVSAYWTDFTNSLFVDNHSTYATSYAGALAGERNKIRHCTFYQNSAANAPQTMGHNLTVNYIWNSVVWGANTAQLRNLYVYTSTVAGPVVPGVVEEDVLHLDPMFVDPDGPDDDLSTWQDNDFSLAPGSPCIDSGNSGYIRLDSHDLDGDGDTAEQVPIDFAGNPRRIDDPNTVDCAPFGSGACGPAPMPDMGAFEGPPAAPLIINPVSGNGCVPWVSIDSDGDGVPDVDDLCEGFDDCLDANSDGVPDGCENQPPVAGAGADQSVDEGTLVTLDGSGSTDPDSDPLTYEWTQVAGPTVTLSDPTSATPTFNAPSVPAGGATLTFQLVVSDGQVASDPASVNVVVKNVNHAPVALAGNDQTVAEGVEVTLSASDSYDPDSDSLSFSWVQTAGPTVTLTGADTIEPSFTAPLVGAGGETLIFEVTVSDGLTSTTDTVSVIVDNINHDPVADAGDDQTRNEDTLVTLDAMGSDDPDNDLLTYAWVQTAGPTVTLSDPSSPTQTFMAPAVVGMAGETLTFELTVHDGYGGCATDEVVITVLDTNAPPDCTLAQPSDGSLWPPNHKLRPITITGVSDPENQNVTITILSVTQDEPLNGLGDGDTAPDAVIQGDTVLLRAERAGGGNGRVYRVHFRADDGVGGVCTGSVTVSVPHDKRPGSQAVDDGQSYSSLAP